MLQQYPSSRRSALKIVFHLHIGSSILLRYKSNQFISGHPKEKLVEKTFQSGYWLRRYWFYCVTAVGLEATPATSTENRKSSGWHKGRNSRGIPNGASCRNPSASLLRSLAMQGAKISFHSSSATKK